MHSAPLRMTLVGLTGLVLACGDGTVDLTAPDIEELSVVTAASNKPGKGGGKGKKEPIPLTVTFGDDPTDGIKSDGLGTYEDGVDGVEAFIRGNGNFHMNVGEAFRKFCLDFPDGAVGPPFDADCVDGGMGMNNVFVEVDGGLPAMVPGTTMSSTLNKGWASKTWSLKFGGVCDSPSEIVTANLVTVTRIDADTWTIEGTNAILCKDTLTGKGKKNFIRTEEWRGAMPFFLTTSVK